MTELSKDLTQGTEGGNVVEEKTLSPGVVVLWNISSAAIKPQSDQPLALATWGSFPTPRERQAASVPAVTVAVSPARVL